MTLDEVGEQFDLPRLEAFNRYCNRFPPTHALVAEFLGYKGGPKNTIENQDETLAELMAHFPEE